MVNPAETLIPCPFSTSYKIPVRQAWQLLRVFFVYRFTLVCLFFGLDFLHIGPSMLGSNRPELYALTSGLYLLLTIGQGICLVFQKPSYSIQAQLQIFTDLAGLTLLMHASGGIESGIGMLLAVSLAAAGLLVGGRCALVFAALASVLILSEQVYSDLTDAFERTAYTYSSMLGISFFTISLLAHVLAKRAEEHAAIAAQRSVDIANLQQLNEHVIQHLQSGIVVLDQECNIRMMNEAALRLFNLSSNPKALHALSSDLNRYYDSWLSDQKRCSVKLNTGAGADINVDFTKLDHSNSTFNMIFLEDRSLSNQRVQQSKLASLGRLAASIAHEIRNPLAAISHASQLLAECPTRSEEDHRLTDIIRKHTRRVNDIIENVLQISRRTPSQAERLELFSWLEKFVQDFPVDNRLNSQAFEFQLGIDEAYVSVDPSHLYQILDNLFTNAIKYGGTDRGKISIKIIQKDQCNCIEVADRGPGIAEKDAENIFEPFFTTSTSGSGLGLYISRELAELNRASLEYEPLDGGGSCFRLCLPDTKSMVIEI